MLIFRTDTPIIIKLLMKARKRQKKKRKKGRAKIPERPKVCLEERSQSILSPATSMQPRALFRMYLQIKEILFQEEE